MLEYLQKFTVGLGLNTTVQGRQLMWKNDHESAVLGFAKLLGVPGMAVFRTVKKAARPPLDAVFKKSLYSAANLTI